MSDRHHLPLLRVPEVAELRSLDEARARRDLMQIGDLARETGKTVRAIHLYEELGLLTPAARSKGRFRLYGAEALTRIRWIGQLQPRVPRHVRRVRSGAAALGVRVLRSPRQGNQRARAGARVPCALRNRN